MAMIEHDVLDATQRRLAHLARENAQLRERARRLRAQVQPGGHVRIVNNAREDAQLVLHLRHSGVKPGRRWLDAAGLITAHRYHWALAMLRYARVEGLDVKDLAILDRALRAVDRAAQRLLDEDDGELIPLRARGNRNLKRW